MTTFDSSESRELAHRINDGVEVTLFWQQDTDAVSLEVLDSRTGEMLSVDVERHAALEAFNHPYSYAANGRRVIPQPHWRSDRPLP